MKNPFPGMNPYCEWRWRDFHTRFVAYAADQLNARLPENLVASTEERLAVQVDEPEESQESDYQADVSIAETGQGPARKTATVASPTK
ncbi:MAG TPA: DUF4058 family protein, partial [Phycisphaerae bacterium]|nr:DUF4058 family protein [Phycisphaerae bacterium]